MCNLIANVFQKTKYIQLLETFPFADSLLQNQRLRLIVYDMEMEKHNPCEVSPNVSFAVISLQFAVV